MSCFGITSLNGSRTFGFGAVAGGDGGGGEVVPPVGSAIPTDYVLRYDFNGDLLDKSANALNGTKTGTANFVAGRKLDTQALQFVAGRVSTVANVPLNSRTMTISFWIKNDATAFKWLMQKISGQYDDFNITLNNGPDNAYSISDQYVAETSRVNKIDSAVASNSWLHIVMTIDRDMPASAIFNAYENNVKVTSSTVVNAPALTNLPNFVWGFGAGKDDLSSAFTGALQDIRIYNRVLTASERQALFDE